MSSLQSVRAFAKRFASRPNPVIDTLINNAGVMMIPQRQESPDGFEMQFATNHVGHFALTGLLLPNLKDSKSPRVVSVSSLAAWSSKLKPGAIDFECKTGYNPGQVYHNTKAANLLFMKELSARYPKILAVAAHPGVSSTNLQTNTKYDKIRWMMQTPESGALPSIRAATDANAKPCSYFAPRFSTFGAPTWGIIPPNAKKADTAASKPPVSVTRRSDVRESGCNYFFATRCFSTPLCDVTPLLVGET